MQTQLLKCIDSLLEVMAEDCTEVGYELFETLVSVIALHRSDGIKEEVSIGLPKILQDVAMSMLLKKSTRF